MNSEDPVDGKVEDRSTSLDQQPVNTEEMSARREEPVRETTTDRPPQEVTVTLYVDTTNRWGTRQVTIIERHDGTGVLCQVDGDTALTRNTTLRAVAELLTADAIWGASSLFDVGTVVPGTTLKGEGILCIPGMSTPDGLPLEIEIKRNVEKG